MGRVVMYARFAAQAIEAIDLAEEESARLRHPWLGTEHLLWGLLRQPGTAVTSVLESLGVTRLAVERELITTLGPPVHEHLLGAEDKQVLGTIGIDLDEVRARVDEVFGPGALERAEPGRCGLPMMPRLKGGLEHAAREAGSGLIETDHLLLGILNVRKALAVELLASFGVTADILRRSLHAYRAQAS
jgi:ATP-dependent Clp protease ATP-binding subunit ClpA